MLRISLRRFCTLEERKSRSEVLFRRARLEYLRGSNDFIDTAKKAYEIYPESTEPIEFLNAVDLEREMVTFEDLYKETTK